jgi:hypothetical protein
MVAVLERHMASKKAGRPPSGKPSNVGKMVRLDPALVAMGKLVAANRGVHLSEYFAGLLKAQVDRDYAAMLRELEKGDVK